MKWVNVEDTIWPVDCDDDSVQWRLRYGSEALVMEVRMSAASVLAAYAAIVDPTVSQSAAISMLKRARTAARPPFPDSEPAEQPTEAG